MQVALDSPQIGVVAILLVEGAIVFATTAISGPLVSAVVAGGFLLANSCITLFLGRYLDSRDRRKKAKARRDRRR